MNGKIRTNAQMKTEDSSVNEAVSAIHDNPDVEVKNDAMSLSKLRAIPNVMRSEEKPQNHMIHAGV